MAGASRTVEISYKADIANLKANLEKIPGITEKEAKAMVKALDRNLQKAEKAAKRAAKNSRKEWKQFGSQIGKVAVGVAAATTAIVAFNQKIADSKNELLDMSTRTGISAETLAGLRLAAEGSGLEFAGLSRSLARVPVLLADADRGVVKAKDAFANLGVATHTASGALRSGDVVFRDVIASLAGIEDETTRAARAADLFGASGTKLLQALGDPTALDTFIDAARDFGVNVGPGAAEAAANWQREMAGLKTAAWGAADAIGEGLGAGGAAGVINDLAAGLVFMGSAASESFDLVALAIQTIKWPAAVFDDGLAGLKKWRQESRQMVRATKGIDEVLETAVDKMERYQRAQRKIVSVSSGAGPGGVFTKDKAGASSAASEIEKLIEAEEALDRIRKKVNSDQLTDADKIEEAYQATVASIDEQAAKLGETDEIRAARQEAWARNLRDIFELEAQQAEELQAIKDKQFNLEQKQIEEIETANARAAAQAAQDHQNKLNQIADEREAFVSGLGDSLAGMSALVEELAMQQAEATGDANMRLFNFAKGAALAEIAIATAVGIANIWKEYGHIPPAAAALTAGLVANNAAQFAAVAGQEPPTFHMGGLIGGGSDSQTISALRGEAVLTRQAVSRIGEGGVNALNRGESPGGGVVVLNAYKHFDRFARDETRRGGQLRRAIKGNSRVGAKGF